MSTALPSVALIVVAYGHAAHLPATLAALQRLHYPAALRQIIVVDNGDGASAEVARSFAEVQVLQPGRNLGFAGGCNLGVTHSRADVIVLVNPDLEPAPDFLEAIVAPLADPHIGIVGAHLRYPDGRLQHAGGWLKVPLLLAQHYGHGEPAPEHERAREMVFVTGAALALRRATWQRLGGLDESFWPAYYEDVDLCLRAHAHGLRVLYEPRARAIHHEAVVVGRDTLAYHAWYHRNRLRLLFKHRSDAWLLATWLPAELAYLRGVADDQELAGLQDAYRFWQQHFLLGTARQELQPPPAPDVEGELEWTVRQVAIKQTLMPQSFRSRWPLVACLRTWLTRLATEAYLRPLIQQQNDFNAAVVELARALERQRRAGDAALLCQSVLLAKCLRAASADLQTAPAAARDAQR